MARGNIYVKFGNGGLYLYTHKEGVRLPKILKRALVRGRSRWGDTQSLTHVIYSEMVQNDVLKSTAFGISTQLGDNDHFILVVDDKAEMVGVFGESGKVYKTYTFQEYVETDDAKLEWNKMTNARIADENPVNSNTGDPYPFRR